TYQRRADSGALQFHSQLGDHGLEAGLGRAVGTGARTRFVGAVGTDHHQIAALSGPHPGQHPVEQALRADQMHLHLEQAPLRIPARPRWTRRCAPTSATCAWRRTPSGSTSPTSATSISPAPGTRTSAGPTACSAARTNSSTEAASVTSSRYATASPPPARILA